MDTRLKRVAQILTAGIVCTAFVAPTAHAAGQNAERAQQAWRTAIAHTPMPGRGCYVASYPVAMWRQVACATAPNVPFVPRTGGRGGQQVGNGNDYAAVTRKLTSSATGSFPVVKRLRSESDPGMLGANDYSLQLNSNFMPNNRACAGASVPADCLAWQQFVYSSGFDEAFMQYWLINYNNPCPAGWTTFSNDCYTNSNGVVVPLQVITELPNLSLQGSAQKSGLDVLTLTTSTLAYGVTGEDSVVFLAKGWNASEFNVIGDGDSSEADFNPGTSLTVRIELTTAALKAVCAANAGTTGETNNLNLGACKGIRTPTPGIQFVESLPRL